jgi:hypothetical protein
VSSRWAFSIAFGEDTAGEPEAHKPERNTDDGEAQQDAAQNVADEDQESTEDEKNQITYQGHKSFPRSLFIQSINNQPDQLWHYDLYF